MNLATVYIRAHEWAMGNGQCPECCGLQPGRWASRSLRPPHPCAPTPAYEGHKPGCVVARALEDAGEAVTYKTADLLREHVIRGTAFYEIVPGSGVRIVDARLENIDGKTLDGKTPTSPDRA